MRFRVGPFEYELAIVAEHPRNDDGAICDGVTDLDRQRIEVYAGLTPARRLNVLLHELAEAWQHHFPPREDHEAGCDFVANVAQAAMQDLADQGGSAALQSMTPEPAAPDVATGGALALTLTR